MKHQWDSPYAWFCQKLETAGVEWLRTTARCLAGKLDSDELQDIFKTELEDDGYYTPFITWHCITCQTENEDHPDMTSVPLCSRCGAEYDWEDLHEYNDWMEEHYGIPTNRGD